MTAKIKHYNDPKEGLAVVDVALSKADILQLAENLIHIARTRIHSGVELKLTNVCVEEITGGNIDRHKCVGGHLRIKLEEQDDHS
jgi:hypothetical protein